MRDHVVITGGGGFLGLRLARRLLKDGLQLPDRHIAQPKITLIDRPGTQDPGLLGTTFLGIDVTDGPAMAQAITPDTVAVFHLAAVVSGQAEAEFQLGLSVNLTGTEVVLEAARLSGPGITVVTTSSLAVFGSNVPDVVTEATPTQPTNSYGMAKAMAELLCTDYNRREWVDARILRLPTIIIRPGRPNAAASSFASSILREPLNGERAVCPVSTDLALWVAVPETAVSAMCRAVAVGRQDWPEFPAVNVPGQRVTVAQMLETLSPEQRALVDHQPHARIQSIVGGWPHQFDTRLAEELGFQPDPAGAAAIVAAYQRAN